MSFKSFIKKAVSAVADSIKTSIDAAIVQPTQAAINITKATGQLLTGDTKAAKESALQYGENLKSSIKGGVNEAIVRPTKEAINSNVAITKYAYDKPEVLQTGGKIVSAVGAGVTCVAPPVGGVISAVGGVVTLIGKGIETYKDTKQSAEYTKQAIKEGDTEKIIIGVGSTAANVSSLAKTTSDLTGKTKDDSMSTEKKTIWQKIGSGISNTLDWTQDNFSKIADIAQDTNTLINTINDKKTDSQKMADYGKTTTYGANTTQTNTNENQAAFFSNATNVLKIFVLLGFVGMAFQMFKKR